MNNLETIKFKILTYTVEVFAGEIGTVAATPQVKKHVGLKRRVSEEQYIADNCC